MRPGLGILFFLSGVVSVKADLHEPLIQIGQLSRPPLIDGRLDDPAWQGSARLSNFPMWTLRTYAADPLEFYVTRNQQDFYFAFRCSVSDRTELDNVPPRAERDSFMWGRPYVRLQFRKGDWSVWIMVDPRGSLADARNEDQSWNGDWEIATQTDSQGWSVEGRIAFSELGQKQPTAGDRWQLEAQNSAVGWGGTAVFGGANSLVCLPGGWPVPAPEENRLPVTFRWGGTAPKTVEAEIELLPFQGEPRYVNQRGQGPSSDLELEVQRPPLRFSKPVTLTPASVQEVELTYRLAEEGSYYATLTVRDPESRDLLFVSRGFWFALQPNRARCRELRERLAESQATLSRISSYGKVALLAEAARLGTRLAECEAGLGEVWKTRQWEGLSHSLDSAERDLDQWRHRVLAFCLRGPLAISPSFELGATHSVVKLQRDAIFPHPLATEIAISAAGNERESFQVAILPFGKALSKIQVDAEDFVSSTGSRISKERVQISLVGYVNIDWDSDYETDRRGWWPDPLMPLPSPFDLPATTVCQPLWVTVDVPPGTQPGEYRGNITVKTASGEHAKVAVKLRVWGFDLPRESHLKTHTWDAVEPFARFYNLKEYPVEWYLRVCDLLLKNRLNPGFAGANYAKPEPKPDGTFDFSTSEKILQHCIDRGLTRFSVIQMRKGKYSPEENNRVYSFIKAYADFLRERGWLDRALVELWDEPLLQEWPDVKSRAERIGQLAPGLKRQLFANLSEGPYAFWSKEALTYGSDRLIDIWAPIPPIEAPDLQARGGEIWTYFCTLARGVAPNFYINRPAVYQRTIGWHCWMYGVDGFEHWSINSFDRNIRPGKPLSEKWPNVPWDARSYGNFSGEGQLVYPGPEGQPLASLRLEVFRDSMEDYEYLYQLRELAEKADGRIDSAELLRIRQLLAPEQYLLIKYPRELRTTLENTIRHPDQPERFLEARSAIAQAIELLRSRGMK